MDILKFPFYKKPCQISTVWLRAWHICTKANASCQNNTYIHHCRVGSWFKSPVFVSGYWHTATVNCLVYWCTATLASVGWMGDRISMSITVDCPSDETLNQSPLVLLLQRQYEFPYVKFSFF